MKEFGFEELPLGKIVGKAKLVSVKKYENDEEHKADKELHLANDCWGNYGFVLEDAERVEAVDAKGKLGFWEFDKEILNKIKRSLEDIKYGRIKEWKGCD